VMRSAQEPFMSDNAESEVTPDIVATLVGNHRRFLEFLRPRVRRPEDAEEILQSAFVKAVEKHESLRSEESAVAWFYRLLRNALVDYYRRNDVARRAVENIADTFPEVLASEPELERTVCRCVGDLVGTLKPEYAELLRRVDLEGAGVLEAAAALQITANNAGVRLHRARAALKTRLEQSCGTCATHGCFDCTCNSCK
jgi:RNA polymerase sigma factor (sigma-70 family)